MLPSTNFFWGYPGRKHYKKTTHPKTPMKMKKVRPGTQAYLFCVKLKRTKSWIGKPLHLCGVFDPVMTFIAQALCMSFYDEGNMQ